MSFTSNISTSSPLLLALFAIWSNSAVGQERARFVTLPLEPAELVAAMPKAPKGWKIKQATAKNTYMRWVQTRATRVFERRSEDGGEPVTVRVTLTDTGRFPPSIERFNALKPMPRAPRGDRDTAVLRRFAGFPAIVQTHEDRRRQIQVLVARRYVIDLLASAQLERGGLKLFVESLNIEALRGKRGRPVRELPDTVTMRSIDELNPKRNRSYELSITKQEDVERMLEEAAEGEDEE